MDERETNGEERDSRLQYHEQRKVARMRLRCNSCNTAAGNRFRELFELGLPRWAIATTLVGLLMHCCWSFTTTKTMLVTTYTEHWAGTLFHNSLRLPFGSPALRRGKKEEKLCHFLGPWMKAVSSLNFGTVKSWKRLGKFGNCIMFRPFNIK